MRSVVQRVQALLDRECSFSSYLDGSFHILRDGQSALKERGIDKMLEEAREDHKESDQLYMRRK